MYLSYFTIENKTCIFILIKHILLANCVDGIKAIQNDIRGEEKCDKAITTSYLCKWQLSTDFDYRNFCCACNGYDGKAGHQGNCAKDKDNL